MSLPSSASSLRCPGCQRPVAGKRPRCLYCGASLEGLLAELVLPESGESARVSSGSASGSGSGAGSGPDLDLLVRQALKTGKLDALKQSLSVPREAPVPVTSGPGVTRGAGVVPGGVASDGMGSVKREVSGPAAPVNVVRRKVEPVSAEGGTPVVSASGSASAVSIPVVSPMPRVGEGELSLVEPPPVVLPPFRHPFALVVEGPGNAELAAPLARALGVDVATARLHCVGLVPRAVLRGPERVLLEEKVRAVQRATGLRAAVVERERMLALPSPWGVLEGLEEGLFRVLPRSHWSEEPPAELLSQAQVRELPTLRLLLVGEVAVGRFRPGMEKTRLTRRREDPLVALHERRLMVVELHGDEGGLRLVEGMSALRALPGFEAGASLRDLKRLVEGLKGRWPQARHEGRFVAMPGEKPLPTPGGEGQVLERTGWPQWEEHARLCRLLWATP